MRIVLSVAAVLLAIASSARAQVTVDLENRYSNVGTIMVWRVDDSEQLPSDAGQLRGWMNAITSFTRVETVQ